MEKLVDKFGLPWKNVDGIEMTDFDNPRIKTLQEQLNQFGEIIARECGE